MKVWGKRMNRVLRAAVVLATAGLAASCALTESLNERSRIEYKSASKAPTVNLEVPPDLSNPRNDDRFVIPAARVPATASAVAAATPTGPGSASGQASSGTQPAAARATDGRLLPNVDGARIERSGAQRWLVINQPPEKLWPLIREFWVESGFVLQTEQPELGLLETDWAENRAKIPMDFIRSTIGRVFENLYSSGERDRFRTRLEAGSGGTEIYISHRGMVEVLTGQFKDSTKWEPRPSDPELEVEFLRRLLVKFGADQERAKAMPVQPATASAAPGTAAAAGPERARLITSGEGTRVDLGETFDRAWRRVGLALDRGGFTVEDRDRSQGVYFVRYIDPEVEARNTTNPGFFGRLFSSSNTTASSRQYRVKLQAGTDLTSITVLSREGQPVTSEADRQTASRMLALLHEQLKI